MKRRTKGFLLVGGVAVATVITLAVALGRGLEHLSHLGGLQLCETGLSRLVDCRTSRSSQTTGRWTPIAASADDTAASSTPRTYQLLSVDITSWTVAECPRNPIARRLLCPVPSGAAATQAAQDDTTGLPLPKPWVLSTAKKSSYIESLHVETPLELATALGFYRAELNKRGWTEDGGALVGPDRAVIAFTTKEGPALLRLTRRDDRTIADLSLRKATTATAGVLPRPGQARLVLGNAEDEDAVITINEQTIKVAAGTDRGLRDYAKTESQSPDVPTIDLAPGKYRVSFKVASSAVQNREFEIAADETWGLLVGPNGVPLPVHLY